MFSCSQQSIFSAMDRFVKAVNNMDATVLVPSKLRDMDINSGGIHSKRIHRRVPPALANTDLYSFYLMLNEVKKELLWGPGTGAVAAATMGSSLLASGRSSPRDTCILHSSSSIASSVLTSSSASINQSQITKQHSRQPSDDSLGSLGSSTVSSSEQDTDSEVDSLLTDRDSVDEHTSHLAAAFRHHLQGLHTILHQLADSADYLSSRYQEEIDASSL